MLNDLVGGSPLVTSCSGFGCGKPGELVTHNPVAPVETRAVTSYKAILVTPQQTLAILQNLENPLHRILVLTCTATALRS